MNIFGKLSGEMEQEANVNPGMVAIVAVTDLIDKRSPVDASDKTALHDILAELDPQQALTVYDFSINVIEPSLDNALRRRIAGGLVEIDAKIHDRLDSASKDIPVDPNFFPEEIPDTLRNIADYLAQKSQALEDEKPNIAAVCSVMSIQAMSHAQIAEVIVQKTAENAAKSAPALKGAVAGDNVVPLSSYRGGAAGP